MDFAPGAAQYDWLEADLAATEATWKVVFHHHTPYTASGVHARYRPKTETIEVLTPDKMESGKRYPVIYALAPLTSHSVIPRKLGERYHLGPLMDTREQDLHNKHQVICIKVMAIDRHMNWNYLQDVVVPYVDRTYPTSPNPAGACCWASARPAKTSGSCSWPVPTYSARPAPGTPCPHGLVKFNAVAKKVMDENGIRTTAVGQNSKTKGRAFSR